MLIIPRSYIVAYLTFVLFLFFLSCSNSSDSASEKLYLVEGYLEESNNKVIYLEGYNGFSTYYIDSFRIRSDGYFKLKYDSIDYGVGYLTFSDSKPFLLLLTGEKIKIKGQNLDYLDGILTLEGEENQLFERYAKEQPVREQALVAWSYLEDLYKRSPILSEGSKSIKSIKEERERLAKEEIRFISDLPNNSYCKWYFPLRKLASSISSIAQYRPDEVSETLTQLRNLNYNDNKLYKSGLLRELLERQFWLIENMGLPFDSVNIEMRISIDTILKNLNQDEFKLNEVISILFDFFEKRSLFETSEYLAIKTLNDSNCRVNENLVKQLESYRAMKQGTILPDLYFTGELKQKNLKTNLLPRKISDLSSKYQVVVLGSSWCVKCIEEIPKLLNYYEKWKKLGIEIVYISLDEDKNLHKEFSSKFPFLTICDYKKWDSPMVLKLYVFATPTIYLIGPGRELLLRPKSIEQIDAWVNYYIN